MSRRFSLDSFDDLDVSLDRAMDQAMDQASNNMRESRSQASVGSATSMANSMGSSAIPLATMFPRDSVESDSAPLMGTHGAALPAFPGRDTTFSTRWKQLVRRLVAFFADAKRDLNRDRIRLNDEHEREITPGMVNRSQYPSNSVSNAKYNPITFVPVILYEQFKFFFNLYFLLVALSQAVPQLRIGYLSSYVVPLAFVLTVTMMKEAGDDLARRRRDREQNSELYEVLKPDSGSSLTNEPYLVPAARLKVGDLVRLHKDSRVPADMVLLQTSDKDGTGEAFIKTDQLDGETDWKLRIACPATQKLATVAQLIEYVSLVVDKPAKPIHSFQGQLRWHDPVAGRAETFPLTVDQTLWANTVLASGTAVGIVIYTGPETRQAMNTTMTGVKTGLLELEINKLSKILCVVVFLLSVGLVLAHGFPLPSTWYVDIVRFLILFLTIIPVSLRVNLDLAKSVYALQIHRDEQIKGTIVRTSTIPEDLGRIEYLLSDKTGTLTQNDMELKKLHLGQISYAGTSLEIVADYVGSLIANMDLRPGAKRKDLSKKVCDLVLTLALCHNVTPTYEDDDSDDVGAGNLTYQAASPDEIAIVKFTEAVGLRVYRRDRRTIELHHRALNQTLLFDILYNFPFNSDTKRMGLVVRDNSRDELWFVQKGADTVMSVIVHANDWLDEETGNMAREGLRTLVIGRKRLSANLFAEFERSYHAALLAMHDRDANMQRVILQYLEQDLELLGLTGVEDKLQRDVKTSIELLRNAGVKIWMLTGDKVETAKCVAISARLILRGQHVHEITKMTVPEMALLQLDYLRTNHNACLLIDGESLATYMHHFRAEFFAVAVHLPAVIACRCTPQQKADVALMIREYTGKRVCCIGDGGNDVSMIQCADVGVGIVGKEGKQASLAADFSIDQFCYLLKLLLWHGRNSYKRSAKLGQFVIHRGLLISVAQAVYSISSHFEPLALYQGWLMVGFSTVYTMAPVFSLTLDCDIDEHLTRLYPELYKELTLGKSLSYKTFFMWVGISLYQGCVIQLMLQEFHGLDVALFTRLVALSFTGLILNELVMVALLINKWNKVMTSTLVITFMLYIGSLPFLGEYFDLEYVSSFGYLWQTVVILVVSLFPVWLSQFINRKLRPPSYAKVQQD